jgi:hypothetical protein
MGTGSPLQRRHGSAKAPTRTRGLATFRGRFLAEPELDHFAKGDLRNAKRPGSRTGRSGRQHFASGVPAWRAMWSGWARKSSRKRSGKSLQRIAVRRRFKGLRPVPIEASPLCLQVSVCRKPAGRLQSEMRPQTSARLRQAKGRLWQARSGLFGVCGKNFPFAARGKSARLGGGIARRRSCIHANARVPVRGAPAADDERQSARGPSHCCFCAVSSSAVGCLATG